MLVSLAITAMVLVNGVVASLLERELPAVAGLEAQHDSQRCPSMHDHGICVQLQQARELPVRPQHLPALAVIAAANAPAELEQSLSAELILPTQARAPPVLI